MAKKWTHEAFEAYVRRLEPEAARDPDGYRRKVVGWIALGYAYIALLLIVTLILLVLLGYALFALRLSGAIIKLGIVLLAFAGTLLRSLWVRMPAPEGIALSPADAPDLFTLVEGLRAQMDAPRFERILLTSEFNAAAAQTPRLGIFGWPRNFLIVGLPLMHALSPEQLASVLAHELGHLRGGHGSFGGKVYQIQATWARLADSGAGLLRAFADWYFPHISAYTFPLRRQDEYEADRGAASAVGARVAADALCLLPVRGQQIESRFWEPLGKRIFQEGDAPRQVFTQLGQLLRREPIDGDAAQKALRDALLADTTYADSHPALKDRLAALQQSARIPEPPPLSAAERYFGDSLARFAETLDRQWHDEHADAWRRKHDELSQAQAHFAGLEARRQAGEALSDEDAYSYASGVEALRSADEALPLYRALFGSETVGAHARLDVGKILLARDDAEGVALVEDAIAQRPALADDALGALHGYHKRAGDDDAARSVYARALRHADRRDEAQAERSRITPQDTLLPHALSADALDELREALSGIDALGGAFLLKKQLTHFAEEGDFLILVIELKRKFRTNEEGDYKALHAAVDARVPMVVLPIYGNFAWLRQRVKALPQSRIFPPA